MKLSLFIIFTLSPFMLLKSMDLQSPEYLIKYPKSISHYHQQKINDFDSDCKKIWPQKLTMKQFMDSISDLTATYEESAPFFLVDDCAQETCILARRNNPHLRKAFENEASRLLQEKITSHSDRPINYTSFCPSGVLSELIILAKTLQQYPSAHINIHLIDKGYQASIEARKAMGLAQNITSQQPLFLDKHYISAYLKNLPLLTGDFNKKRHLFISILFAEMQHKQFISYLTNTFWNANLSLYFYQSIDEYLAYAPFVADVLTTIDIANENYDSNPYGLLCLATLYANPQSANIALDNIMIENDENDHDNTEITPKKYLGPCLFSYSTKKTDKKQTKSNIIGYDNEEHTLYASCKKLQVSTQKTHW